MYPLPPKRQLLFLLVAMPLMWGQPKVADSIQNSVPEVPMLAQTAEERKAEGDRLLSEGVQFFQTSQFQAALDNFQKALVIYRELGESEAFPQENRSGEGITLMALGLVYENLGEYPKALEVYEQALFIFREVGFREAFPLESRSRESATLNNLGAIYRNLGEYPKALEVYEQALFILREAGIREAFPLESRLGEGTTLAGLGAVYLNLGQYPQALEYYEQALFIFREAGVREAFPLASRSEEGTILNGLGAVYFNLGEYPPALEFYEQALFIHQEVGNRVVEGATLNNLGNVYLKLEQYPKAIEFYEQALFIRRELGDRAGENTTLNNLGLVYNNLGQYPKAIEFYEQALTIIQEVGNRPVEGATLNNLGEVYNNLGQYLEAERYLFDAIVVYESLRSTELSDADKISIFETQSVTYRILQQVLIAQNKIETALEISERGRARAFVELMARRQHGNSGAEFVPPPPPTLADIQQVAREQNATLVEYSVNDTLLYIWVIRPTGEIDFRQIDISATTPGFSLDDLMTQTHYALGVRGLGIVPRDSIEIVPVEGSLASRVTSLQTLHQLLIEPISDLLPKTPEERVIFIPHSELFLVPFPALADANGTQLIDKHTILTAPAIQVLQLSGGRGDAETGRRGDVLVVGNPVMPSISLNPGDPPVQLSSLPGAETEAKEIAQMLGTEPLIGRAATEPIVVERMKTARIVHLATHGILDDEGGIGSSIALTPESGGNHGGIAPTELDGFLTAQEILGLNLNTDLMVLSACDTGRGKVTGDGVVGLSRSLVTAGVSSLVVSLWQVPDAATAMLMTRFYENLQQGLDKATALRNAMLSTRATYPDPADWAAFTLMGEV